MNDASLSPDGHAVAFVSPVGGIAQVFLMLTSGGEPLQLTNDEGDKVVDSFSPDGEGNLLQEACRPRRGLGGAYARWGSPPCGCCQLCGPSPDGIFIYYVKMDDSAIFRSGKSGLNEEFVYNFKDTGLIYYPLLLFPGGNYLLAAGFPSWDSPNARITRINVTSHEPVDLGEVSGNFSDVVWA